MDRCHSISMPADLLPIKPACLLVLCFSICQHPHYRPCLLACYLNIGHACWSIATATDILLVGCRWKKDGYKYDATCTEVPLYQTCLLIQCHSQICLLCTFIQIRMFVKCCSIRQDIWSVANPSDEPTGTVPLPWVCKTCRLPSWTPS